MSKGAKKTVGVYMDKPLANALAERANNMHISLSLYLTILLQKHVDSGEKLKLEG